MGVFRDITIPFAGVDYVVTPSNKLLRRIEMKGRREDPGFNLVAVFYRSTAMSGGYFELAFVLAELINDAGGKVTEDHALAEIMGIQNVDELRDYVALICSCVMPEADGKKTMGATTETST